MKTDSRRWQKPAWPLGEWICAMRIPNHPVPDNAAKQFIDIYAQGVWRPCVVKFYSKTSGCRTRLKSASRIDSNSQTPHRALTKHQLRWDMRHVTFGCKQTHRVRVDPHNRSLLLYVVCFILMAAQNIYIYIPAMISRWRRRWATRARAHISILRFVVMSLRLWPLLHYIKQRANE